MEHHSGRKAPHVLAFEDGFFPYPFFVLSLCKRRELASVALPICKCHSFELRLCFTLWREARFETQTFRVAPSGQ